MSIVEELRQKRSLAREPLTHHPIAPLRAFSNNLNVFALLTKGLAWGVVGYVVALFVGNSLWDLQDPDDGILACAGGVFAAFLFWFKPYGLALLSIGGKEKRYPTRTERFIAKACIALLLIGTYDFFYPRLRDWILHGIVPKLTPHLPHLADRFIGWFNLSLRQQGTHVELFMRHPDAHLSLQGVLLGWLLLFITISLTAYGLKRLVTPRQSRRKTRPVHQPSHDYKAPFHLWLGQSTGRLAQHGHPTSLKPDQHVGLELTQACHNLIILGGIGSGKTTRVIHPLLVQLLDQHCGGLIFDIKGDFHTAVHAASALTNRTYQVIGPGFSTMNLLEGLSPTLAASMLKSGCLLSGTHADIFWVDTATELCRHALGLLVHVPEHYTLKGLYDYLFVEAFQKHVHEVIESLFPTLPERERRALLSHERYSTDVFERFDEKVKAGVRATCAQLLAPFSQIELMDTFCEANSEQLPWASLLEGHIFLVNLPLAQWGLGVAS